MSLILEALKKSEAERRLGQVPGLMTPVQRATPRGRGRLPLVVGGVVVLAVAVLAGWWWTQQRATPEVGVAAVPAVPADPPSPPVTAPVEPPSVAPPAVRAPAPATPPPAALPSDPDFASTERESRPVTPDTPPPTEPVDAPPAAIPPPPRALPAPRAEPRAVASEPAPLPVPARVPPADADAALDPLPRLADLSGAERDALPPLKLSMHVYAAEPAARFVLVDGKRLVEGDRPANGLVLAEIRRDGAVFEHDGRRFLVPRL